ncbi:hypothetical protein FRC10_002683 [Ceratobasidium sp. 414]|nr:hypothetical protein FRC10_002683 [Ceratobasidium sp. 414]
MKLSIADNHHAVPYPYPIHGSKSRLRVARKSHYVEIIVPMADPLDSGRYYLDRAPIIQNSTYSPWNIHHVFPDLMPRVDLEDPKKLEWLSPHLALQFSNRELDLSNGDSATKSVPTNALMNVKESIRTLVKNYSGVQGTKARVFGLSEADSGSAYAILLVAGLRLDPASFTVVIDAALVPVSTERASSLAPSIERLDKEDSIVQIVTSGQETVVWKNLLPAFVERCRTWLHKPNCEYAARDKTPLMINTGENLICSCGAGAGFEGPEWEATLWEDLLLFATRAAISPLFPVSFVEYESSLANDDVGRSCPAPEESGRCVLELRWGGIFNSGDVQSVQKGKVLLGYMSKPRLEGA